MSNELESALNQIKQYGEYTYHSLYLDGKKIQGMRECTDRLEKMYFGMWPRILDIGCNMGGMLWPYRYYYREAIGLEKNITHVNFCNNIKKVYDNENRFKFLQFDLNTDINQLNYLGEFDVIYFLAMTQHLSNWKQVLKWAIEHSNLLFIEYNGQPDEIKEYMEFTKKYKNGLTYLGEYNGRFLYICYNKITFNLNGVQYDTYKYIKGSNCDTYYCPEKEVIIKYYLNDNYKNEIEWSKILKYAPEIIYADEINKIVVEECAGHTLNYFNLPDDYEKQIEDIKKDLIKNNCSGEDIELFVKDNKIKIVDLAACYEGKLVDRIDIAIEYCRFRNIQYKQGIKVTAHNNNNI